MVLSVIAITALAPYCKISDNSCILLLTLSDRSFPSKSAYAISSSSCMRSLLTPLKNSIYPDLVRSCGTTFGGRCSMAMRSVSAC